MKKTSYKRIQRFVCMGLILAMVSTQTVMLLVSTLCFMKGVG